MINEKTINLANQLADGVSYSNARLTSLPNTPLSALVKTLVGYTNNGDDREIIQQSVIQGSIDGSHSVTEEMIASKISTVLGNIVSNAKNVVNPHCRAILDEIEVVRQNEALQSAGIGNIIQVDLPAVLTDSIFLELLEPYRNSPTLLVRDTDNIFKIVYHDFTQEERLLLIRTGSANLDAKVSAIIAKNEVVFSEVQSTVDVGELTLSECIIYFLLLTGIQQDKLDKCASIMVSASDRRIVAELRASIAGRLYRNIERFEANVKDGIIIAQDDFIDRRVVGNCLTVFGTTYRDWIQNKGGSPQAALGYLAEFGNRYSLANEMKLRNEPASFMEIYENRMRHARSKAILNDIDLVRRVTANYMVDVVSKMTEVNRPALQARLSDALQHEYHGAATVRNYVIKVVCRTLTDGNDTKDILLEIDSILASSESPDLKHAVYIATIRLVARWIASQIKVEAV